MSSSFTVSEARLEEPLPWPLAGLLLVRHGESEWNATGRWQGQADPPLTDLGRSQADRAAQRLGRVDRVYCSDLVRASETAERLAAMVGIDPQPGVVGLRERDAGEWQGHTRAEIERNWPGFLESGQRPLGFEDDADLLIRVRTSLAPLLKLSLTKVLVVVAHGGVVRALTKAHGLADRPVPNLAGCWVFPSDTTGTGERLGDEVRLLAGTDVETRPAIT